MTLIDQSIKENYVHAIMDVLEGGSIQYKFSNSSIASEHKFNSYSENECRGNQLITYQNGLTFSEIMRQLFSAVSYLHENRIVHR